MNRCLTENPQARVEVFVIWEPVLAGDTIPPRTMSIDLLTDRRVQQFWDPGRLVSNAVIASIRESGAQAAPSGVDLRVMWDYVSIHPPKSRWLRRFPIPEYSASPVMGAYETLRRRIEMTRIGAAGSGELH
jgi:hypothetical protein